MANDRDDHGPKPKTSSANAKSSAAKPTLPRLTPPDGLLAVSKPARVPRPSAAASSKLRAPAGAPSTAQPTTTKAPAAARPTLPALDLTKTKATPPKASAPESAPPQPIPVKAAPAEAPPPKAPPAKAPPAKAAPAKAPPAKAPPAKAPPAKAPPAKAPPAATLDDNKPPPPPAAAKGKPPPTPPLPEPKPITAPAKAPTDGPSAKKTAPEPPSPKEAAPPAAQPGAGLAKAARGPTAPRSEPTAEHSDAVLAVHRHVTRQRLALGAGVLVGLAVTIGVIVAVTGSDEATEPPTPEAALAQRLEEHVAALDGAPPADSLEVVVLTDLGLPGVALARVGVAGADPSQARECVLLDETPHCRGEVDLTELLVDRLDLADHPELLDDARWAELGAWLLEVPPDALHDGGPRPPSTDPLALALVIAPAAPSGLGHGDVAAFVTAAAEHLGPGDSLIVSVSQGSELVPFVSLPDVTDTLLLDRQLAASPWPPTRANVPLVRAPDVPRRHLIYVEELGSTADSDPATVFALPDAETHELSVSAIAYGGTPSEVLVAAAFHGNGRVYSADSADLLTAEVRAEVARVSGRGSPLAGVSVSHPDGGTLVSLHARTDTAWRRIGLHLAQSGEVRRLVGPVWHDNARAAALGLAPRPELLTAGIPFAGRLASGDPINDEGTPVDRLDLTVNEAQAVRVEVVSDAFAPRLAVLRGGSRLASNEGAHAASVALTLEPGAYEVVVEGADGELGEYTLRVGNDPSRRPDGSALPDDPTESEAQRERRERRREREREREGESLAAASPPASPTALTSRDVREILRPNLGRLTACAHDYHGGVTLQFTVESGGGVSAPSAEGTDIPSAVQSCLGRELTRLRFDGYVGPDVIASYIVVF